MPLRQAASQPGETAQSLAASPRTELPGIPQGICFPVANSSNKSPIPRRKTGYQASCTGKQGPAGSFLPGTQRVQKSHPESYTKAHQSFLTLLDHPCF